MEWLTFIGSWALRNWLPLVICAVLFAGWLWVTGLRNTIAEQKLEIEANKAEIVRVTDIAVKQSQAFEFLKEEFVRYEALVTGYIEKTKAIETSYDKLRDDFERDVPNENLDAPVDPYMGDLLRRIANGRGK